MNKINLRSTSLFAIIAVLLFIVFGGSFAYFEIISASLYGFTLSIVGTLASIIGLLSLLTPRITSKDFKLIESDLIEEVTKAAKSAADYEALISKNKEQLESVKRDRNEIELIVRKVSLRIFLEERLRNIILHIGKIITEDKNLTSLIKEYEDLNIKILEIGGEINTDKYADIVSAIITEHEIIKNKLDHQDAEISISFGPLSARIKPFSARDRIFSVGLSK